MKLKLGSLGGTTFLTNPRDIYVGKSLEVYGEWSYGEVDLIAKLVKPSDCVLEVGANIGGHTVFLARDVVPQGRVFAFEPRRHLFQLLCANVALNSLANVHAHPLAVGREPARLTEGLPPDEVIANMGAFALGQIEGEGETIEVIRLDDWLPRLPRFALIKADVEGHEQAVLAGAKALIQRDRPYLYLENDRPELSRELIGHVFALGYDCWWHPVPLYRPQNFGQTRTDIFGGKVSLNMLCAPRELGVRIQGMQPVQHEDEHPLKGPKAPPA